VEIAKIYNKERADEIVFLDITASFERRPIFLDVVKKTAEEVFMPLTVGGGINSIEDIRILLNAGADKVSINTAAVLNPNLIFRAASMFGSQCIVVAIDARKTNHYWEVYTHGGHIRADGHRTHQYTYKNAVEWAQEAESLGAGEILLTSMDADGTKNGYDIPLTKAVAEAVNIPVIASGGAGCLEDFYNVFAKTSADAALAASVFHYGEISIGRVKYFLKEKFVEVRL